MSWVRHTEQSSPVTLQPARSFRAMAESYSPAWESFLASASFFSSSICAVTYLIEVGSVLSCLDKTLSLSKFYVLKKIVSIYPICTPQNKTRLVSSDATEWRECYPISNKQYRCVSRRRRFIRSQNDVGSNWSLYYISWQRVLKLSNPRWQGTGNAEACKLANSEAKFRTS